MTHMSQRIAALPNVYWPIIFSPHQPIDNALDRDSYFAICWPSSEDSKSFKATTEGDPRPGKRLLLGV
jgi:hypothetical protein